MIVFLMLPTLLAAAEVPEGAFPVESVETYVAPATGADNKQPFWLSFEDPALTQRVEAALANNYDVKAAAARIVQAEAQAMRALSPLLPQVTADASISGSRAAALGA
ncbi:MAG: TolC family protein, partial [Myxococcota bacterium]